MKTITAGQARSHLGRLLKETAAKREPIRIRGKSASAVLLAHDDWQSIQETLYLLSIPGMRESIREGLRTPVTRCRQELDW